MAPDTSLQRLSAKRSISPSPSSNSPAPERRAVVFPSSTSYCVNCGSSSWPSQQQPQPSAPLYEREALSFSGAGEAFEAATSEQLGGSAGLTVLARVRRTNDCGPAWDRLIDFGNGEEKENIVINFQREMMYEVRGPSGSHQMLAVAGESSSSSGDEDDTSDDDESAVAGCSTTAKPTTISATPHARAAASAAASAQHEGSALSGNTFPANQWVHISLVHGSDGTASIFWNGRLKARGPVHLPQRVHREKNYVGRSHWSNDPYFRGDISELHVFDYALSEREVCQCAAQRSLPRSLTEDKGRPIISLADSWREIATPRGVEPSNRLSNLILTSQLDGSATTACGGRGCGGIGRCSNPSQSSTPLQYLVRLCGERAQRALEQLIPAAEKQKQQIHALEALRAAAYAVGATREAGRLEGLMATSLDALQRCQAVCRMIRYSTRMPTALRREAATGQMRQPPQIAAATDPSTGLYHAFAIYELRSGDVARGGRFHVYITDIFSMRCLLPFWTCWRPTVGSLLISLLQRKAEAEQEVVVLRALHDAACLEAYYERLGFTKREQAFEDNGLADSFVSGDMLYV